MSFPKVEDREENGGYWSETNYLKTIAGIKNMKVALMVLRGCDLFPRSHDIITSGVIDVWWMIHEGGLLLLLPYILSKNQVWGKYGAKLRIFVITTSSTENPKKLSEAVTRHLGQARIAAAVTVVDMSKTSIDVDMRVDEEGDTYSKTVGEWFGKDSYEVPYVALSGDHDLELGHVDDSYEKEEFNETIEEDVKSTSSAESDDSSSRMKNAIAFNKILKSYSSDSNLVVTNMPKPFPEFFDYIDAMCDGLDNVLLVKGSGKEVITTYA
jgi:potassium/chloride transporter 4/5/6